jgi:thiol-disulfide isomerase/thioredoxin
MSKYFVFVKINGDVQTSLKSKFGISGYPTIKFMKPDESIFDEIGGYEPLPAFLDDMRKAAKKAGFSL